jgi:hypothetical protein
MDQASAIREVIVNNRSAVALVVRWNGVLLFGQATQKEYN